MTGDTEVHESIRPEERAKIDFDRKHFEVIGPNIEFTGLEKDINQFMLQAISR